MRHPLNRRPTTLANRDPKLYQNLWRCAGQRARGVDNERASREYQTAHAMWAHAERCKVPAFVPNLPDNIIPSECYDQLLIDRGKHIAAAMNGNPVTVPDYLSELICESVPGWQSKVAVWLSVNDDSERIYQWHNVTLTDGDLSGDIDITYFVRDEGRDQYWQPFYAVIDSGIYDCTDSTVADCDILENRIGWYVTDIHGKPLPDDCRTDQLSAGYSSNPTAQLDAVLFHSWTGQSEPTWHWGLGCYVARLQCWPHPVRLYPEAPYYDS